jgi:hypothetical protein
LQAVSGTDRHLTVAQANRPKDAPTCRRRCEKGTDGGECRADVPGLLQDHHIEKE